MRGKKYIVFVLVACATAFVAVSAWGHYNLQSGGPNADTIDGHEHTDDHRGHGGCDDLLGRGAADIGYGGDSGCDTVRGMDDSGDLAIVCDDGAGNDQAYGGAGGSDECRGSSLDYFSDASCEVVSLRSTNC